MVHSDNKSFSCNQCDKLFTLREQLTRHVTIHTGEKPFTCMWCQKTFRFHNSLKTHERTHTGEKPYNCKDCTKSFTQLYSLKVHERIHSGERPFPCSQCKKCFKEKADLKRHKLVHSRKKDIPLKPTGCNLEIKIVGINVKQFSCSQGCGILSPLHCGHMLWKIWPIPMQLQRHAMACRGIFIFCNKHKFPHKMYIIGQVYSLKPIHLKAK